MGLEYIINYQPADEEAWSSFVMRLDNPSSNGWPAFDIELEPSGVFFRDNARTAEAAVAFRRITAEALAHEDFITIAEAE